GLLFRLVCFDVIWPVMVFKNVRVYGDCHTAMKYISVARGREIVVVDAYISYRRSKAGKRFDFVRFIKVLDADRLVNNLCTVWVGRHKLQANIPMFQREPLKRHNSLHNIDGVKMGNSRDTDSSNGVKSAANSYAHVVKRSQNSKMDSDSSPVMVLDDSCLNEKDYSLCLMRKVKDFATLANLKVVVANEGFDNIKFKYMGGRVTWVEIEGIPLKMWSKNTFNRVASKWSVLLDVDDQEDEHFHGKRIYFVEDIDKEEDSKVGSYEEVRNGEDVNNVKDLEGDSEGEIVPDTKFEEDFPNQKGEEDSVGQGILCVWDPNMFKKTNSTVSDYFVMVRCDWMPNEVEKKNSLEAAQKVKIKWAIEGDENSKYYHGVINKKRNQLSIRSILVEGTWIDSPSLVKNKQILDGTFILNELVQWCKKKKKQSLVFKVDFKKASFQRVVDVGLFKGIELAHSLNLSHMFYADDAIFMGQWTKSNIDTIVKVLDCFNRASGIRINMTKSKLLGISVEDDKVKQAAAKIGCNTLKTPFSYLGSKVGGCMSRIQSWNETIEKMAFPNKVLHRMESMRSHFFNGAELSCKKVIKALHGYDGKIGQTVKSCYPSLWLDIIHEVEMFKSRGINLVILIHSKLGNGANTSFWEVAWREGSPFKSLFPKLYALETQKKIDVASKKMIDDFMLPEESSKTCWIKAVPIKVNVHARKAKLDGLPTRLNISRR
nr:RNA-directed DNA polymerase, eukaryota, reverse transcriptase zinc-binding domain protein [Tanacetum cinerariifolium]